MTPRKNSTSPISTFVYLPCYLILSLFIVACGGGGSGGGNSGGAQAEAVSLEPTATITRDNAGVFAASAISFAALGTDLANEYVDIYDEPGFGLDEGDYSQNCDYGGSMDINVRDNGKRLSITSYNCRLGSELSVDGVLVIAFSEMANDGSYTFTITQSDFTAQVGSQRETGDGTIQVTVPAAASSDDIHFAVDVTIKDENTGEQATASGFTFNHPFSNTIELESTFAFAGYIDYPGLGVAQLSVNQNTLGDRMEGASSIKGVTDSNGLMTVDRYDLEVIFYENDSQQLASTGVKASISDLEEDETPMLSLAGMNRPPEGSISFLDTTTIETPYSLDMSNSISDPDLDMLAFTIRLYEGGSFTEPNPDHYTIEQTGYGSFDITFHAGATFGYSIDATATDPAGNELSISGTSMLLMVLE
jgi:hypothetical protein